ncbi:hypothetical protein C2E31_27510 [Rhodopirellula baltica]|nr:hypothetical protein C2E31_27510 [Rhodopirellula baltica]
MITAFCISVPLRSTTTRVPQHRLTTPDLPSRKLSPSSTTPRCSTPNATQPCSPTSHATPHQSNRSPQRWAEGPANYLAQPNGLGIPSEPSIAEDQRSGPLPRRTAQRFGKQPTGENTATPTIDPSSPNIDPNPQSLRTKGPVHYRAEQPNDLANNQPVKTRQHPLSTLRLQTSPTSADSTPNQPNHAAQLGPKVQPIA